MNGDKMCDFDFDPKLSEIEVIQQVANYMQNSRCYSMRDAMPIDRIQKINEEESELDEKIDMLRWKRALLYTKNLVESRQMWTSGVLHHINCILQGVGSHKCGRDILGQLLCPAVAKNHVMTHESQFYFSRCRYENFNRQYHLKPLLYDEDSDEDINDPNHCLLSLNTSLIQLRQFINETFMETDYKLIRSSFKARHVSNHLSVFDFHISTGFYDEITCDQRLKDIHYNVLQVSKCCSEIIEHLLFNVSFAPYKGMIVWRDLLLPVMNLSNINRTNDDLIWQIMYVLVIGNKFQMFAKHNHKMMRIIVWALSYKWNCTLQYDTWSVNFWTKIQWHVNNLSTDFFNQIHAPKLINELNRLKNNLSTPSNNQIKKNLDYKSPDVVLTFHQRFDYAEHLTMVVNSFSFNEFTKKGITGDIMKFDDDDQDSDDSIDTTTQKKKTKIK